MKFKLNIMGISVMGILLSLFFPAHIASASPAIINVSVKQSTIEQYKELVMDITLSGTEGNKYDAAQVDLSAEIATPGGVSHTVPAFFTGSGNKWKVRYTPTLTGEYSYYARLKTPEETITSPHYSFRATYSSGAGFIRRSKNNPYYLVFDSGKTFFGLGHNIAWVTENNVSVYKNYFSSLKENGCNLTRIWLNSHWTLRVEDKKIGDFNRTDCRKVDKILKLAEAYGIYVILVFDSYGTLMKRSGTWNEGTWNKNPYNKANGGPCKEPEDFFTSPEAKNIIKDVCAI